MEHYIWTAKPAGLPKIVKRCGKCGHTHFITGGRFRVNANGNRIDVWLIWSCERCKATWNMDILSRVRAGEIDGRLYRRFLENDRALALQYALDKATLCRNGVVLDPHTVLIEVDGTIPPPGESAQICLSPELPLNISATKVVAQTLGVSHSAIRRLAACGLLETTEDIQKKKLTVTVSFRLLSGWETEIGRE